MKPIPPLIDNISLRKAKEGTPALIDDISLRKAKDGVPSLIDDISLRFLYYRLIIFIG